MPPPCPFRTGRTTPRSGRYTRFSGDDPIGNAAVVAAAGLVWWTGAYWPDLAVAAVIAGLFLQSSRSIVRDALGDLRVAAHV